MIAADAVLFLEAVFSQGGNATGALKQGEVAFKGLRKPRIRIMDPDNPAHYVVCRNILSYPHDDTNVVFMNPVDYSYFMNLGFEAGDEVLIVEA